MKIFVILFFFVYYQKQCFRRKEEEDVKKNKGSSCVFIFCKHDDVFALENTVLMVFYKKKV